MRQTFTLRVLAACALGLFLAPAALAQDAEAQNVKRPMINVQPFADLAEKGYQMSRQGQLDLSRDAELEAAGELNEDGTLKPETVTLQGSSGDGRLYELGQQLISAISQSKILSALEGAKAVRLTFRLDRQTFHLGAATEFATAERASQMALGYDALLKLARLKKQGTAEGALFEGVRVTSEGRGFRVVFEMPKAAFGRMIEEMVARRKAAAGSQ